MDNLKEIVLTIPYPPSINQYKKIGRLTQTKNGKLYQTRINSPETKLFYCQVMNLVRIARIESLGALTLSVEMDVYPPDNRKRDIDNVLKVAIDSLMHSKVFDDDSQIARLLVTRRSIIPQGQIVVRVKEMK